MKRLPMTASLWLRPRDFWAVALLMLPAMTSASEEVLFSRAPNTSELAQALVSDTGPAPLTRPPITQQVAGTFSMPVLASVSRVTWPGFYYGYAPVYATPPPQVYFQLRVFADNAGAPEVSWLYAADVAASVSPFAVVESLQTYSFTTELATPILVQPNTRLWLSVIESDPATTDAFRWFHSLAYVPIGFASRNADGVPWSVTLNGPQMSFSLLGTPVPEPSIGVLLCTGLGIVLRRGSRHCERNQRMTARR